MSIQTYPLPRVEPGNRPADANEASASALGIVRGDVTPKYQAITRANVASLPQWQKLAPELREAIEVVSLVFPFKTNRYVTDQLIDWDRVPNDPIFQLTFPQAGMLEAGRYRQLRDLVDRGVPGEELRAAARRIQDELNPHPAGQATENVPFLDGKRLAGLQHKYRQSVLFFPQQGQTCHAYCTFCFRWPQFVGRKELQFANIEAGQLVAYLRANPHVTDVIFTGGDPMVMKTAVLQKYLEPLLDVETVQSIRIGSKSLGYWPQRFVEDADADDVLRLFERVVDSGRHLAFMAHTSHPIELSTRIAEDAIKRVRRTGAMIRTQSPVLRHINDDPRTWTSMWMTSARLGMIPYYMFVERDTGPRGYFEMPLVRSWEIFSEAYRRIPGIARTVRGPAMSCFPGKCHMLGVQDTPLGRVFILEFLQARNPDLVRRPFLAQFDPQATWFDQLRPFGAADEPFFASRGKRAMDDLPHPHVSTLAHTSQNGSAPAALAAAEEAVA